MIDTRQQTTRPGPPDEPERLTITDVGSTTTKAFLFERADGAGWRFHRREAPTTVEKPEEDVTVGVRRALESLEQASGTPLLGEEGPLGTYLSTSSAGGGLAMVVTGLVREVTSRSAERVALGAGAILLDVIAMNDGRTPYEKIEALERLRPDIVLLAGGFDGDAISGPVFLAELVRESGLRPKLTRSAKLPVLYAGNVNARDFVEESVSDAFMFVPVANIRPSSEIENLDPAREAIQELFMGHVMSHAPGYERLVSWVSAPILPTPAAFAAILAHASRELGTRILAIDIGGATTDVFTAIGGKVSRTVSANLGMSYSILNVIGTAGLQAVQRVLVETLGIEISDRELLDIAGNKYLRPTGLPENPLASAIEQAIATVAVREAVRDHESILAGKSLSRGKAELAFQHGFDQRSGPGGEEPGAVTVKDVELIIGSGGILSHSPPEAAGRILDAAIELRPETELAIDNAFMFPHLGVLAESDPRLALELFSELGLVRLGTVREWRRSSGKPPSRAPGSRIGGPMAAAANLEEAGAVRKGRLCERRELATPGEVLVRPGEDLEPEAVVARSRKLFLRPFFLPVAAALRVKPHELGDCLEKREGDEVAVNELVAKRARGPFRTRVYRSPVAGRIDRVLADGTLLVRELPEAAADRVAVTVTKELQLGVADDLRRVIKVAPGQQLEKGQELASIGRPGSDLRTSRAPFRGRVVDIDFDYGVVTIDPLREELEVRAWLPGRVVEVSDRGAMIACEGIELTGAWGIGGEVGGPLTSGEPGRGMILVRDRVGADDLRRLVRDRVPIAGLVTGGLHLDDLSGLTPHFAIVVMDRFAGERLPPPVAQVLGEHEGSLALLDGTTELRVGVRRPRVLLPEGTRSL